MISAGRNISRPQHMRTKQSGPVRSENYTLPYTVANACNILFQWHMLNHHTSSLAHQVTLKHVRLICNSMGCCSIWINCTRNAGRKLIVLGFASHYYNFLPALLAQLIPNTTAPHPITYTNICNCSYTV